MTKISGLPGRQPVDQEIERVKNAPSPASYDTLEAFNALTSPKGRMTVGRDKRSCFVDQIAKLNVSPGPVVNSAEVGVYDHLTLG